jgi:hypothetical protein
MGEPGTHQRHFHTLQFQQRFMPVLRRHCSPVPLSDVPAVRAAELRAILREDGARIMRAGDARYTAQHP